MKHANEILPVPRILRLEVGASLLYLPDEQRYYLATERGDEKKGAAQMLW